MFEYLSESSDEKPRDILSEIATGELDERYLIKHSNDYGKCTTPSQLRGVWQMITANLLNLKTRFSRRKHIRETMEPITRSAAH